MRSLQKINSIFHLNTPAAQSDTIVFIDAAVTDYRYLAASVKPGIEVVILKFNQDGIEQISKTLSQHQNLKSIQIVSHGRDGSLQLGSTILNYDTLFSYLPLLWEWREAIALNANLILYGCNVANTEQGKRFVKQLSQITGTKIAASENLTGNAAQGGDWELAYTTETMEITSVFPQSVREAYKGILATFVVNNSSDFDDNNPNNGSTSLREAIRLANERIGEDSIDLTNIPTSIFLNSSLPTITDDLNINGNPSTTINGRGQHRIFSVSSFFPPTLTISELTLSNGVSRGGNGTRGGGGGLGAGGALFINRGDVILENVRFFNNQAIGGNGSNGRGDGNRGGNDSGSGQTGFVGGAGAFRDGAGGGFGGRGGAGGFGGGGGGANVLGGGTGGGGGGGANVLGGGTGGGGGGGAGGAAGAFGGRGENGQSGGNGRSTFTGNSPGSGGIGGDGGGGAGLGGAVFVHRGSLSLSNVT